jgi:hypothetical protein
LFDSKEGGGELKGHCSSHAAKGRAQGDLASTIDKEAPLLALKLAEEYIKAKDRVQSPRRSHTAEKGGGKGGGGVYNKKR